MFDIPSRSCLSRSCLAVLTVALCACAAPGACSPASGEPEQFERPGRRQAEHEVVFGANDMKGGFEVVDGWAQSPVLPAKQGATRGGFLIDLRRKAEGFVPELQVRGVGSGGAATPWVAAKTSWSEHPHLVAWGDLPAEVTGTQIRLPAAHIDQLEYVTYAAVIPAELSPTPAEPPGEVAQSKQALSQTFEGLVQPRSAWGARKTKCSSKDTKKTRMAIHHTFTPPGSSGGYEARLRSIQAYHMDTRNWCDIGYHFLVTEDGRIWEGRSVDLLGAHVSGNNSKNVGLSWVGCYQPGECAGISSSNTPTDESLAAGAKIIRKLSDTYAIAISAANIKGHRDFSGASTTCPGDELASRMGDMFTAAQSGGWPDPAPTPPPPPPPPPGGNTETSWTCDGTAGTKKAASGSYYVTSFGCWVDGNGNPHSDPGDNCIPWCKDNAGSRKAAFEALCGGLSGPACEQKTNWFAAGADRFGCAARLRVANPKTGKAVVVAVLDRGPACWVEAKVGHWVLDLSYPTTTYLFGGEVAVTEKAEVQAEEVSDSTPLGPTTSPPPTPADAGPPPTPADAGPPPTPGTYWKPAPGATWQWQLTGTIDQSLSVDMYDVDLVNTPSSTIASLRAAGRKAVCYFSAGSREDWRPDAGDFAAADYGKPLDGWPDERWLDVRRANVRTIMKNRLDLARSKGCDGVEPDNVDGYSNDTGFPLTSADQVNYNRFLAIEAHARGLSVGLKNTPDLVSQLVSSFDWELDEQCLQYSECAAFKPFLAANKAVFHVEYVDSTSQGAAKKSQVCSDPSRIGFSTLIKMLDLDAWRIACP
jgi:hypothetical protein